MNMPSENTLVNLAYHGSVLTALNVSYSMLLKSVFKTEVDLVKLNLMNISKLLGITSLSIATRDYLVRQKIIPASISM